MDLSHISQLLIPVAHAQEANAESGGVMATLGINWKLFLAQLVNFGIILGILWKFVFIPVTKGLQARTEKIEKAISDADSIAKEKEEFAKWREQEMTATRQQTAGMINQAKTDANKTREEVLKKTKEEQEKLVAMAKEQIESEKKQALSEVKSEIAGMVTMAAEKILRQKLDPKTDKELIKDSLARIK